MIVISIYRTGGLNEPFAKDESLKCLLDYMAALEDQAHYIFRNLLVISLDLFSALEYFASRDLVHRDVKRKYMRPYASTYMYMFCNACRFQYSSKT